MTAVSSLKELYRYRVLAQILIMRDLKGRYRGTALGFFWIMLNPLLLTLTYVVVFSVIFRVEMENFPVFVLSGILPWIYFSTAISESTTSIISNGGLINKVFLPSEIFPLVCVGTNMLHYLFSVSILLLFLFFFGIPVSWNLAFFPLILVIQVMFIYGLALIISALTVQFRDLQQMVPNLLLIWFFLTPIIYPITMVPEEIRNVIALNPVAYLIMSYQDIFFYNRPPSLSGLTIVAALSCILIVCGFSFFETRREFIAEEV